MQLNCDALMASESKTFKSSLAPSSIATLTHTLNLAWGASFAFVGSIYLLKLGWFGPFVHWSDVVTVLHQCTKKTPKWVIVGLLAIASSLGSPPASWQQCQHTLNFAFGLLLCWLCPFVHWNDAITVVDHCTKTPTNWVVFLLFAIASSLSSPPAPWPKWWHTLNFALRSSFELFGSVQSCLFSRMCDFVFFQFEWSWHVLSKVQFNQKLQSVHGQLLSSKLLTEFWLFQ